MPHHHGTTGLWEASVFLTVALAFVAVSYLRGWLRLRSTAMDVSPSRGASFLLGLFLIWVATASPVAAFHHELLTVHMIQHLLLMTLASPLIWLGEPLKVFFKKGQRWWSNAQRFERWLTQPVGLFASTAALVGWHIPAAFAVAMESETWHLIALASFLATGLLFWWPVIHPWPSVRRPELSLILYLFFATLPCDILSGFLVFCDRVVYPAYFSSSHLFGFSALGDQQCAAALMWTCVTIVYLIAAAILTMQLLSPQGVRETHSPEATSTFRQKLEAV